VAERVVVVPAGTTCAEAVAAAKLPMRQVCLSGGVALNCSANALIDGSRCSAHHSRTTLVSPWALRGRYADQSHVG
jgi:hypothetical protein